MGPDALVAVAFYDLIVTIDGRTLVRP